MHKIFESHPAAETDAAALRDTAGGVMHAPLRAIAGAPDHAGDDDDKRGGNGGGDAGLAVATRSATRRPSMYKVLMLNDDYTPMEFVVHVLERFFGIGRGRAEAIMMTVHRRGVAVVGVFSFEVAETKVTQVMEYAQQHQHPLQCTLEKE